MKKFLIFIFLFFIAAPVMAAFAIFQASNNNNTVTFSHVP